MDRTREWVASHESLGLPALPPKPTSGMPTSGIQSIPYGYENVLPISQRYQQNPYSMLSSAGTDTETMTCTSDDESEYSTNKMQQINTKRQMMKLAIARNTVIEENPSEEIQAAEDEKRYRKRLAVSETSI